ncbi:MAG: class I SAM-dependent methyltransferase [Anaerolineae bacterium]|nr:class I SAM-dependent methyltransferase [Anaerolineae bacterium]
MDVSTLSFNTLLLFERAQLRWFPGWRWSSEADLALAICANPAVEWYLRHKCPEISTWVDRLLTAHPAGPVGSDEVRRAEVAVLHDLNDLVTYAVDPAVYDAQPFLGWDSRELTSLVDFAGNTVIDVGAGTGRLALAAAGSGAATVFAVEPVANLRRYLKEKASTQRLRNVYPVDGLITDIPFPDGFADVVMGGHVFGDEPEAEYAEVMRVTKPGGTIIFCPGSNDRDDDGRHKFFVSHDFRWCRFEEPQDGWKRRYWKQKG